MARRNNQISRNVARNNAIIARGARLPSMAAYGSIAYLSRSGNMAS